MFEEQSLTGVSYLSVENILDPGLTEIVDAYYKSRLTIEENSYEEN